MFKARLLLVSFSLVCVVLFFGGWNFLTANAENKDLLIGILSSFTVISIVIAPFACLGSLILLAFSFFKVQVVNGQLVYNPNNFYWKMIRQFMPENRTTISLCQACWITALYIGMVLCLTAVAFMFGFLGWIIATQGIDFNVLVKLGQILACLAGFVFYFVTFGLLAKRYTLNRTWLYGLITCGYAFLGLVFVPIWYLKIEVAERTLFDAIFLYLKGVSVMVPFLAAFTLFFILLPHLFTSLPADNMLKRFLISLKERACPILSETPT